MHRCNFLNALEFNYNKIIHQQIDSISKIDPNGFINHRQLYLYLHVKPEFP